MLAICLIAMAGCSSEQPEPSAQESSVAVTVVKSPDESENSRTDQEDNRQEIKKKVIEVREWYVDDVWNTFVDIDSYIVTGKSATGDTIDIGFAVKQFNKAMGKKSDYDEFMAGLGEEYSELKDVWSKVSEQIDALASMISSGVKQGGDRFDSGLLEQYSDAFYDLVNEYFLRQ